MPNSKKIVLVLANLMSVDGILNDETASRVKLGYEVFVKNRMDFIFFIGWDYRPDSPIAIADAMVRHLGSFASIDSDNILVNRQSRDSVGDAILSRIDLEEKFSNYELSVVSSEYHIPRLQHIFPRVYGTKIALDFFGAPIETIAGVEKSEAASIAAFDQTFDGIDSGDLPRFLKRLQSSHPFYNGKLHPILDR